MPHYQPFHPSILIYYNLGEALPASEKPHKPVLLHLVLKYTHNGLCFTIRNNLKSLKLLIGKKLKLLIQQFSFNSTNKPLNVTQERHAFLASAAIFLSSSSPSLVPLPSLTWKKRQDKVSRFTIKIHNNQHKISLHIA